MNYKKYILDNNLYTANFLSFSLFLSRKTHPISLAIIPTIGKSTTSILEINAGIL